MSENENWKGKAVEILPSGNETFEQMCERIGMEMGVELKVFHNSWAEAITDAHYRDYVFFDGRLFKVLERTKFDPEYCCECHKSSNGEYEFHLAYYNGGTCFTEMFEEAVLKAEAA